MPDRSRKEKESDLRGHVTASSGLNAPGAAFYGDVKVTVGPTTRDFESARAGYSDRQFFTFLQRELRRDSPARLLDPALGQRSLADVFVDLETMVVPNLVSVGNGHLHNVEQDDRNFLFLHRQLSLEEASRTVLTGGPGQGKTTAVQMLAQVHRCAMLRGLDPEVLSPQTAIELTRIDRLLDRLRISPPVCARLPLWVEAEAFAAYLDQAPEARRSLWHYLAERHERILNITVTTDTIRTLAEGRPTLMVLDGYDEVAPQHRRSVMDHVMDFSDEIQMARANATIIVTSRPQAYEDELRPHGFVAWAVAQLTPEATEEHAAALAGPGEEGRRLVELFRSVLRESAAQELLNSPLHVALLVSLLAGSGPPPTGRHRLFSHYYDHVYSREQGRGGVLGTFLENNRHLVDELHRRAAFYILLNAENGLDRQKISHDEFTEIARNLVQETDGIDDNQVADTVGKLIRFARERLVLIVGIDTDKVGFQIKSFTEFLAATHLGQTSDERLVRERFRAAAASEQWRNVARFMAAAAFETGDSAERDLRDSVLTTFGELDSTDFSGSDALLLRGAELAIDLLSDVPDMERRYRSHLIPSAEVIEKLDYRADKLAIAASKYFDDSRIAELVHILYAGTAIGESRNVWHFLNTLAEHGNEAAAEAAREYVHCAHDKALPELLCDLAIPHVASSENLVDLLGKADPNMVRGSSWARDVGLPAGWASSAWELLHGGSAELRLDAYLEGRWPLMGLCTLRGWLTKMRGLSNPPPGCHPRWLAWAAAAQALRSPDTGAAGLLLRALPDLKGGFVAKDGPWPLQEATANVTLSESLGLDIWSTAEERWQEQGVRLHDVETYLMQGALGRHVAKSGFPFGAMHWGMPGRRDNRHSALAHDVWVIWRDQQNANASYRANIASNVILPMCDYVLRYNLEAISPQWIREAILAIPAANDASLTFQTVLYALSECPDDKVFGKVVARLVRWGWSTDGEGVADLSAVHVIERAKQVLPPAVFRKFCRKIAQRSAELSTWEALTANWVEAIHPGDVDWPLTNLLRIREVPPHPRDIACAVAVVKPTWMLFDLTNNMPFWSDEVRTWVREQMLIQIGEPWLASAPSIWHRPRQPVLPTSMATLGLTIPSSIQRNE